jgi:hypothetical protein
MLTVRFVGLYDTVSTYGYGVVVDIDNDTRQLDLDAIRKARHTLQLTASDEHRDNFALTNIKSALSRGKGETYALPGVHADVGGCYNNVTKEDPKGKWETKMFNYYERDYVLEQGWYTPDQIEIINKKIDRSITIQFVKGTRALPNTYSYIPLTIMADKMIEKEIPIHEADLKNDFIIPEDLQKVKARIDDHIFNGGPPLEFGSLEKLKEEFECGKIALPAYRQQLNDSLMIKKLRNEYLHFSAGFGFVNNPNRTWSGRRKREIIDG